MDVAPGPEGKILIFSGYRAGPEAGDGGQWEVEFLEKDEAFRVVRAARMGRPTSQMGALGLRLRRRL